LGIPDDAVVFASAANYYKIIPEMQQAWAKLLAAVPNSRLLVHPFNPNWSSSYPIKRFCAEFDRVLAEHGVSSDRLIVSTAKFASRTDVRELLSVADVYLDTFPFGGVNSLVDPLEAGVPTVVWEGSTFRSRMGAALLRAMDLPDLIATNPADYVEKVLKIATDRERRAALSDQIKLAMDRIPIFLDTLAASDAFGDLVEVAFDEIVSVGNGEFRRNRTPLRAEGAHELDAFDPLSSAKALLRKSPASSAARHAYGNALLATGEAPRATEYLLAAIQTDEKNPKLWFDLAQAFQRNGQPQQALEALEASLKLDLKNSAGWTMVAELAEAVGAFELAAEANSVLQYLAATSSGEVNAASS
jgi:protein O-GlcNAc transferase